MKAQGSRRKAVGGSVLLALLLMPAGCYTGVSVMQADDAGPERLPGEDEPEPEEEEMDDPIPAQPLHRLNRLEYDNTVHELLGTELRPADGFGPDPEANGFDNMAEQLALSPVLLDGYAQAAREVIADGLDLRPTFSARFASDALEVVGGYPVGDLWALTGNAASVAFDVPTQGEHELVLTGGASTIGSAPEPTVGLEVDGQVIASFTVQGGAATPVEHVHPVVLDAGPHTVRVVPTNFINDAPANISNNVLIMQLTARSVTTTEGPGHERVYVCEPEGPDASACYETIIAHFAARAWRRPLLADEESSLLELWETLRSNGETDEDALRLVMRTVMTSPKFFYRMRTLADDDSEEWLDDYVLASRLSYFLWSSMPDERLFEMAEDGRLSSDEGLREAVAWMLDDPRAQALVDGFAEQWLSTRHFAAASPSPEVYPGFDDALRDAMTEESRLFFGDFLDSGAPVHSMIQPDFAYRNDRLAEHYGVSPVGSPELMRVPAGGDERRGLLSLGAWLTARSDAEHSSPIRRGQWISDRLLCTPVPPPPPGLEIDPVELGGGSSVREQLEMHRSDPTCATCHSLLDVLGIGLEEYDGVGRRLDDVEVDNLGELPDGRTFEGAAELSELYAQSDVFVGCLTTKMFSYAVGRPITGFDRPYLDEVTASVMAQSGDLRALIDAIVHTPAFRSPAVIEDGASQ